MSKHFDIKSRVVINKMQTSLMTIYSRVIQSYVVSYKTDIFTLLRPDSESFGK